MSSLSSTKVVVVGSCMMDFVSYAPRLPKSGETIHGSKFVTNFGGKGANQCVAAAKLGAATALVARVGDDIWGTKYIEQLNTTNVDTKYIAITPNVSSGIAQINVADTGENQIVIVAGANNHLSVTDVENSQDAISSAAVLILQLETPVKVAIRAIQLCRRVSILNGAPALTKYDPQLLRLPTIFCVNETEASVFTGLPVTNNHEAEIAALNLLEKGCNSVLITLGPEGAIYVDQKDKNILHISSPKVKSVDTTGAGDAFLGALTYLLAYKPELGIEKSIRTACCVAADSVTRLGTQISFPGPSVFKKYNADVDCLQVFIS